jgi:hypothetical protein
VCRFKRQKVAPGEGGNPNRGKCRKAKKMNARTRRTSLAVLIALCLARATPRAWLEQGKKITVKNSPTYFGTVAYEITSDVDNGKITATVELPTRKTPARVILRFRHPKSAPIKSVTVNGNAWAAYNKGLETIELKGLNGTATIIANY